jgi:lysozyme family protein
MADFVSAYKKTMDIEKFILTNTPGDAGGQTYAGISRRANPQWEGWKFIDRECPVPEGMVSTFYKSVYWDAVNGDLIISPVIADSLFDFSVNAGVPTAKHLAQQAVKAKTDGIFGPLTMAALNSVDAEVFSLRFSLLKIKRYRDIVESDHTQLKFLEGWISRTLTQSNI